MKFGPVAVRNHEPGFRSNAAPAASFVLLRRSVALQGIALHRIGFHGVPLHRTAAWPFIMPIWGFIMCPVESVDIESDAMAIGAPATPKTRAEAVTMRAMRFLYIILNSRNGDRSFAKAPVSSIRRHPAGRYARFDELRKILSRPTTAFAEHGHQTVTRLDTNQDRLVSMTTRAVSRLIPVRSVDDDIKSVCSERAIGSG